MANPPKSDKRDTEMNRPQQHSGSTDDASNSRSPPPSSTTGDLSVAAESLVEMGSPGGPPLPPGALSESRIQLQRIQGRFQQQMQQQPRTPLVVGGAASNAIGSAMSMTHPLMNVSMSPGGAMASSPVPLRSSAVGLPVVSNTAAGFPTTGALLYGPQVESRVQQLVHHHMQEMHTIQQQQQHMRMQMVLYHQQQQEQQEARNQSQLQQKPSGAAHEFETQQQPFSLSSRTTNRRMAVDDVRNYKATGVEKTESIRNAERILPPSFVLPSSVPKPRLVESALPDRDVVIKTVRKDDDKTKKRPRNKHFSCDQRSNFAEGVATELKKTKKSDELEDGTSAEGGKSSLIKKEHQHDRQKSTTVSQKGRSSPLEKSKHDNTVISHNSVSEFSARMARNSSFPLPRRSLLVSSTSRSFSSSRSQSFAKKNEENQSTYKAPKIASNLRSFRLEWNAIQSSLQAVPTSILADEDRNELLREKFLTTLHLNHVEVLPDTSVTGKYTTEPRLRNTSKNTTSTVQGQKIMKRDNERRHRTMMEERGHNSCGDSSVHEVCPSDDKKESVRGASDTFTVPSSLTLQKQGVEDEAKSNSLSNTVVSRTASTTQRRETLPKAA